MNPDIEDIQKLGEEILASAAEWLLANPSSPWHDLSKALLNFFIYLYQCAFTALKEIAENASAFASLNSTEQLRQWSERSQAYYTALLQAEPFQEAFAACFNAYTEYLRRA